MSEVLRQVAWFGENWKLISHHSWCSILPTQGECDCGRDAALAALREMEPSVPVSKLEAEVSRLRGLLDEAWETSNMWKDATHLLHQAAHRGNAPPLEYCINGDRVPASKEVARLRAEAGQETRCDGSGWLRNPSGEAVQGDAMGGPRCPGCSACTPQVEEDDGE